MKEKNVVSFYVLCNKLKNLIRTGWKNWNVKGDRLESVAEHIYGTQMLAIAMYSEFNYDIDLYKVIKMLAIHELGEIIIGDFTLFDISREEKEIKERKAVHEVLSCLGNQEELESLFMEFDSHSTDEAKFAYMCDKLECDIQSKIYDQENRVDLDNQDYSKLIHDNDVYNLLKSGASFSTMWLTFGQKRYPYDDNFRSVSNYVINNNILKK